MLMRPNEYVDRGSCQLTEVFVTLRAQSQFTNHFYVPLLASPLQMVKYEAQFLTTVATLKRQ